MYHWNDEDISSRSLESPIISSLCHSQHHCPPCQGSSKQGISAPLVALNQSAFDRFQKGDVGDKAGNLLWAPVWMWLWREFCKSVHDFKRLFCQYPNVGIGLSQPPCSLPLIINYVHYQLSYTTLRRWGKKAWLKRRRKRNYNHYVIKSLMSVLPWFVSLIKMTNGVDIFSWMEAYTNT